MKYLLPILFLTGCTLSIVSQPSAPKPKYIPGDCILIAVDVVNAKNEWQGAGRVLDYVQVKEIIKIGSVPHYVIDLFKQEPMTNGHKAIIKVSTLDDGVNARVWGVDNIKCNEERGDQ